MARVIEENGEFTIEGMESKVFAKQFEFTEFLDLLCNHKADFREILKKCSGFQYSMVVFSGEWSSFYNLPKRPMGSFLVGSILGLSNDYNVPILPSREVDPYDELFKFRDGEILPYPRVCRPACPMLTDIDPKNHGRDFTLDGLKHLFRVHILSQLQANVIDIRGQGLLNFMDEIFKDIKYRGVVYEATEGLFQQNGGEISKKLMAYCKKEEISFISDLSKKMMDAAGRIAQRQFNAFLNHFGWFA